MKKFISIFGVAAMAAGCLAGCGQKKSNEQSDSTDDGKLKVVTTTFPEYDWVDDTLKIDTNKDMKVINLLDRKKFMMSMESPLFCMKRKSHLTMISLWHFWKMIIRKKLSVQKDMCGFMTMTYMYSFLNRLEEMFR